MPDNILVRARRYFRKDAGGVGAMVRPGDEFELPAGRAAQLRDEGMVEYASAIVENEAEAAPPAEMFITPHSVRSAP